MKLKIDSYYVRNEYSLHYTFLIKILKGGKSSKVNYNKIFITIRR